MAIKRHTSLMLAVVLTLTFLFASAAITEATVVIKYRHDRWRDGEVAALEQSIKEFEAANPGIKIDATFVPWQDIRMATLRDIASGQATADVVDFDSTMVNEFARLGYLYDLSEFLAADKDLFVRGSFDVSEFNGGIYAVPFSVWMEPAMFYRPSIFAQLGLEPATHDEPWTMDQALQVAQKLTRDTNNDGLIDTWGWVERAKLGSIFSKHFWWHLKVSGTDVIKQDGTKWVSAVKDSATVEAIRFYTDLVLKYKVAPADILGYGWEEWRGGFVRGSIAMGSMGMWSSGQLYDQNPDTDWDAMPLPYRDQPTITLYQNLVGITKNTKYPEEAWKWVRWITTREKDSVMLADAQGSLSPLNSVLSSPEYIRDPRRAKYAPFIDDMQSPMYRIATPAKNPKWVGIIENIVGPKVHEVITGTTSFDAAIDAMDKEVTRVLRD